MLTRSPFLALLNHDDSRHERALSESARNQSIVTSEFVLLELRNACARAEDHADFLTLVRGIRASPRFSVVPLGGNWEGTRERMPYTGLTGFANSRKF